MSTVVLDSHVVHWWSAEPDRISGAASKAISAAEQLRTIPVTPAIASTAAGLPSSFRVDPADRSIYATAIENGLAAGDQGRDAANASPPPSGRRLVGRRALLSSTEKARSRDRLRRWRVE